MKQANELTFGVIEWKEGMSVSEYYDENGNCMVVTTYPDGRVVKLCEPGYVHAEPPKDRPRLTITDIDYETKTVTFDRKPPEYVSPVQFSQGAIVDYSPTAEEESLAPRWTRVKTFEAIPEK